uniref:UBX domain-containing protein n=1 Tax=Macrostomum lignano TaxID=282301 RepID=A0A1I8FBQ3_9PLAT
VKCEKKEELECTDRLTREDILVWLENCGGRAGLEVLELSFRFGAAARSCGFFNCGQFWRQSAAQEAGAEAPVQPREAAPDFCCCGRLLTNEVGRSHRAAAAAADASSKIVADEGAIGGAYQALVNESDESEIEGPEQEELWREMEHVVNRLRQDRLSICRRNIVTVDRPLILENSQDVMQLIERLQLGGHLRQLTELHPCVHQPPEDDLLSSLPQASLTVQKRRYLRAVSDNGVLPCRREAPAAAAAVASEPVS